MCMCVVCEASPWPVSYVRAHQIHAFFGCQHSTTTLESHTPQTPHILHTTTLHVGVYPHDELEEREQLPADFNYALYLEIQFGRTMGKVINVDTITWGIMWLFVLLFFLFQLSNPSVSFQACVWVVFW